MDQSTSLKRLRHLANVCEQHGTLIAAMLLGIILIDGTIAALGKPFWLDEIMGLLIAKLPSTADIWAICRSGADNQPVFFHLLIRTSIRLFGNDALGIRFPALVGFTLFCWCLYLFVRRSTSQLYGLIAMLFPAASGAWFYATDGRPYGLLLGFAGLACVSWQTISIGESRRLGLVGLAGSLLLALNIHYYAVLLIIPLGAAEIVRSWRAGKLDWPVWFTLVGPLVTLSLYVPVVREAKPRSGVVIDYVSMIKTGTTNFFTELLEPFWLPLAGIVGVYVIYRTAHLYISTNGSINSPQAVKPALRERMLLDLALTLGFALWPLLTAVFSRFVTHIFFTRYAVPGVLGAAVLLGFCLWFAFGGRRAPALVVLVVILASLSLVIRRELRHFRAPSRVQADMTERIPATALHDDLPIAVEDAHEFMELHYYLSDPNLQKRLVYLIDEQYTIAVRGASYTDRMMIGSAPFFKTRVLDCNEFLRQHAAFYVLGSHEGWLGHRLLAEGMQLNLLSASGPDEDNYSEILLKVQRR